MNEYKLTIHLHPSIEINNQILTGKVQDEMRILDGILFLNQMKILVIY